MTVIEEFQQQIRERKLFNAFTLAVSEALELKITTWVSSSSLDTQAILARGKPLSESCLRTRINLLNGEIENKVGSEIINNQDYAELKKLHQEQVKTGRETILKNLEGLQKMLAIMGNNLAEISK